MKIVNFIRYNLNFKMIRFINSLDKWILRHKISIYYKNTDDIEIRSILSYIKNSKDLKVINYVFIEKYKKYSIDVLKDNGNMYILHDSKKIYFPTAMSESKIISFTREILLEQNENSPHRYIEKYSDLKDMILIEVGAAEGSFSLNAIDFIKKVFIFECDEDWSDALRNTFKGYKDRVEIINQFVSDKNNGNEVSLDSFIDRLIETNTIDPVNDRLFIKMDIEGTEVMALNGLRKYLENGLIKGAAICAYHNQNDEKDIREILNKYNFDITTSKGYMLFLQDKNIKKPYFRRGVIRAIK